MQAVDDVVHAARLGDKMAIVAVKGRLGARKHFFDDVGHAQRLARGVSERHGRRLQCRRDRDRAVWRDRPPPAVPAAADEQPGQERQKADEERCDGEIEGGMEVRCEPARRRLKHGQPIGDRPQERHGDQRADQPRRKIAERQPHLHRITAGSFENGVDGAPDIGAEHHRKRRLRAEQAGSGERHDREHDDHAGMREPCKTGGERNVE